MFFVIVGELLFIDQDGDVVARENHVTSMDRIRLIGPSAPPTTEDPSSAADAWVTTLTLNARVHDAGGPVGG